MRIVGQKPLCSLCLRSERFVSASFRFFSVITLRHFVSIRFILLQLPKTHVTLRSQCWKHD